MMLSFPKPCRSFDATRSRVCFWGYDRTIEITFFAGEEALKHLGPDMAGTEAGILKAFDAMRDPVHKIAGKVYARVDKGSIACLLAAENI